MKKNSNLAKIIYSIFAISIVLVLTFILVYFIKSGDSFGSLVYKREYKESSFDNREFIIENKNISSLSFEIGCNDLDIEKYDGDKIKIVNRNINYDYSINEDRLKIYNKQKGRNRRFDNECYIKVFVPKNASYSDLNIVSSAGDVSIDSINVKNMNVKLLAGDLDIKNFAIDSTDINLLAGDIDIELNRDFNSANLRSSAGDIDIELNNNMKVNLYNLRNFAGDSEIDNKLIDNSLDKNKLGIDSFAGDVEIE